jgi:hypothetical protein
MIGLYDILDGNVDDVTEHVVFDMQNASFQPQIFTASSPMKISRHDRTVMWRFSKRQQTYAMITCRISVRGDAEDLLVLV